MESNANPLHPVLHRLLEKRGLSQSGVEEFFSWDLRPVCQHLGQLDDLEKATERILAAMDEGESIGIYGDYDADGTSACALWHHFFGLLGYSRFHLIQPHRLVEGYGLHVESIERAQELGIQLLVTVDCGISNHAAAEYAREKKLDLIITDHHREGADGLPAAYAVVNPNRGTVAEDSPLRALAGVGVAFALCLRIRELILQRGNQACSLAPLLPFVAIGTVCDMVPLNFINQRLTRHGLKKIKDTSYPGLKALFSRETRELDLIPSEKLSFETGPLINSKGRIGHPERALKLLTSDDPDSAFEHYQHLLGCNRERKEIQARVFEKACEQIGDSPSVLSLAIGTDWHEGVIGIVASKLVERFKVPAIVLTRAGPNTYKASARTAGTLSIFDCLSECRHLFEKFGGHHAAAGFSLVEANLESFCRKIEQLLGDIPTEKRTRTEKCDLEISPSDIVPKLVRQLERLEPFGNGNPRPRFQMRGFHIESFKVLKDVHVRWNLSLPGPRPLRCQGISFHYLGREDKLPPQKIMAAQSDGKPLCASFTLGMNRYRGAEYIQLQIEQISITGQIDS